MKIVSIEPETICELPFLNAGRRAGDFYVDKLPIHIGYVDKLPNELEGIVVTADLQGRERFEDSPGGQIRLLGEVLPNRLANEILPSLKVDASKSGVFLAGDFYTYPALHKRGGSGDVTKVWEAFGEHFRWVVGVAGNHDTFGDRTAPQFSGNKIYLDGHQKEIDGIRIAGVGGIIGNPKRAQRRAFGDYMEELESVCTPPTDVLIMHDGPDSPSDGFRGSPLLREYLEFAGPKLIVRGHAHWKRPLTELQNGVQVLNVDARVVILLPNKT